MTALGAIRTALILRSGLLAASRRMGERLASWFETREDALLTMRHMLIGSAYSAFGFDVYEISRSAPVTRR
jgi:hypothetical protein